MDNTDALSSFAKASKDTHVTHYAQRAKLLVVDDDPGVLRQLKWALQDEYEVILASSRQEALNLFSAHRPELVALDVNLDGDDSTAKDGIDILEEIKAGNGFSKVIMITANDTKEVALDAIGKGAFDYYTKPVNIEELKVIFKRALHIQRLEKENKRLSDELHKKNGFEAMVGSSGKMEEVFSLIRKVAPTDTTVLITGESGTGKELVAKAIHYQSLRKDKPFIVINCGAIPENLLESELFGHEKGSFTDAYIKKVGKLEIAGGGTVFLDEIGEMSLGLQVKILRFLQERVIERVGGNESIELDVRIIAATNSDLTKKIENTEFREDLYYRLSVVNIDVPPLKDRGDDILVLSRYFLSKYKQDGLNKDIRGFAKEARDAMKTYTWPGNVREMENKVKRAVILAHNSLISSEELGFEDEKSSRSTIEKLSLKEARKATETAVIRRALVESDGNMSLAAKMLGVTRPTLYDLIRKHGISTESTSHHVTTSPRHQL